MTFDQAQTYLRGLINEHQSRRLPNRLERIRTFLGHLGDPQERYPIVHVAGTSGKGSTATMAAEVLRASGRRVGLHAKPHISSVTERARIDGVPVSEDRFAQLVSQMLGAADRTAAEIGRPTYYEVLLALAFLAFAEAGVDIAVIEAGVGGTLDGTNVISRPVVSVITNVGLDHMETLGPTTADIALDKAGIARRGVPLVTDARDADALREITAVCAQAGALLHTIADEVEITPREMPTRFGQAFGLRTPVASYDIEMPVLGAFQRRNAATAVRALELAGPFAPTPDQVAAGLAVVQIPGRMEVHPTRPVVVFDIAHNADKARNLVGALLDAFPGRRISFVIAISETKDAHAILAPFLEIGGSFTFTSFEVDGRLAMRPQRLASIAESMGMWSRAIVDPVDAFAVARRNADAGDVVVVTGSTYIVSELRSWWYEHAVATSN